MRILGIDCASSACAVALRDETHLIAEDYYETQKEQTEVLVPMVKGVLQKAGLSLFDIDALAVTTGPGSFTGLRIGLATVGGLSTATNLPIIGIQSPQVIAYHFYNDEQDVPVSKTAPLLVVLESKRADIYAAQFDKGQLVWGPVAQDPLDIYQSAMEGSLFVGDGVGHIKPFAKMQDCIVEKTISWGPALTSCALIEIRRNKEILTNRDVPAPCYLKPPKIHQT